MAATAFAKLHAANEESRTLAALRDTLLPKLISGELRVKDAEKFLHLGANYIRPEPMQYDSRKHHRRSLRLKNYDYRQAGAYLFHHHCHAGSCVPVRSDCGRGNAVE